MGRHDAQLRRITDAVAVRIQRQGQPVRRGAAVRASVPARSERHGTGGVETFGAFHDQFVVAPLGRCAERQRLGPQRGGALLDPDAPGDRLPIPVAEQLIPLVPCLDPVDGPSDGLAGGGAHADHLETGSAAFGQHIVKAGFDPDQRAIRRDGLG